MSACAAAYGSACHFVQTNVGIGVSIYYGVFKTGPGSCGEVKKVSPNQGTFVYTAAWSALSNQCPANSSEAGSACTCNSGYREDGSPPTSCVALPVCPAGQSNEPLANYACMPACTAPAVRSVGIGGVFNGCFIPGADAREKSWQDFLDELNASGHQYCTTLRRTTNIFVCDGPPGATVNIRGSSVAETSAKNADGSTQQCIQGPFTSNGASCDPDALPKNATGSDGNCKAPKVPGQIHGVTVCVNSGSQTTDTKTKTGTGNGGGLGGDAPPNAKTAESQTKCTGDACTTTTTYKDASGVTVGTSTDTQPQKSFCQENPSSPVCKQADPSEFSGACGARLACKGDAIQCATAAAVFKTNCKIEDALKPDDALSAITTAAQSGADGQNTDAMKAAAAGAAVNVGSFDVTGKGWSRACPVDPVVEIAFGDIRTFTLPFSKLCSPLQILSNAAVSLTLLASLLWVIGGRKT
jgi:hypothetical protein